jgi:hypothetical protein
MYWLLTLRTLHAEEQYSYHLPRNGISVSQRKFRNSILRRTKVNSIVTTTHKHTHYSRHETLPQPYTQFCNKHNTNASLNWAHRYLKNTSQLIFRSKCRALTETLKISITTKYCNSVGELISEFHLPKNGGTYAIINNIC